MHDELKITRRHLPHWHLTGLYYFITFRIRDGYLADQQKELILQRLIAGDSQYYQLLITVVLNDHIHIILRPNENIRLSRIMQGIKGASAREINKIRNCTGALWQSESFDRIIRNDEELLEKANYILYNPVKLGIIKDPWKYPFIFVKDIKI